MKKILLLMLLLTIGFTGCTKEQGESKEKPVEKEEIKKKISMITDFGNVDDNAFNTGSWSGVQSFSELNNCESNYYRALYDADSERVKALEQAIDEGADVLICPGTEFSNVVYDIQSKCKQEILLIDTEPIDENGNVNIEKNVYCIIFKDEEVGYLAGYAAVKEGYRKLGYIGGIDYDSVKRFGYGYAQGIEDAAKELGLDKKQVQLKYCFAGKFEATEELTNEMKKWYEEGTEVIFSCGGGISYSVIEASKEDPKRKIIGVDVDQSSESEQIIFSAMKNLEKSISEALTKLKKNDWKWPEDMAGSSVEIGVKEECVGLSANEHAWRMSNYTIEDYNKTYKELKEGKIRIINNEMPNLLYVDLKMIEIN